MENAGSVKGVKILQSWQGDFLVSQFKLLPEDQRKQAVGFLTDGNTFTEIWQQFKPDQDIPEINFKDNLIIFARNIQFYNHISIGQVKLTNSVIEIIAMETMSAMPIEEHVAFSLAVIPRQPINAIQIGDNKI